MGSSYLYLNGLRVHYLHWNVGGEGRPLVLLHDLSANARFWELVGPALAQRGHPVFAPDLRGHGLTDRPDGPYAYADYRRDLLACLDAWELSRPVLAGQGWGAALAVDYAAHFSFGGRAPAGLVLVDGAIAGEEGLPGACAPAWRLPSTSPDGARLRDLYHRLGATYPNWGPDDPVIPLILNSYEVVEEQAEEPAANGDDPEHGERLIPRLRPHCQAALEQAASEQPLAAQYPRLSCPVLIAPARPPLPLSPEGEQALLQKEVLVENARRQIPNARVEWVPGTTHDVSLHQPERLAELIAAFTTELDG